MSHFLSLFTLSLLTACGRGSPPELPHDFVWHTGDTWQVEARYRSDGLHTELPAVALDGSRTPQVGAYWSDTVTWTYQVVETGLLPPDGDPLHAYAATRRGLRPLSVVRAWASTSDADLATEVTGAAPTVYLVFREDRDRLAAVVSFRDRDGDRVEEAWSTKRLDRSTSTLSQSMLTMVPTYLAPHGVTFSNGERVLEDGSRVLAFDATPTRVDLMFDDVLGGGAVFARYEAGAPWPTEILTDSMEATLVSNHAGALGRGSAVPPENYDFRSALRSSIDLDAALTVDESHLNTTTSGGAPDGYLPWNGSWWPQKSGDLVFGYTDAGTLSDRVKEDIAASRADVDRLGAALQDLKPGTPDYDATVEAYVAAQTTLVDALVAFYDDVHADLDGGTMRIEGDRLVHDEGWSYTLSSLSPMDKTALALWARGGQASNPFYLPAWELLNHYSPGGGSWWGHCNGWSAAAVLTHEPTQPVEVDLNGSTVAFTPADLKGLLSESHYSTLSQFYGARYYSEDDDLSDLTPAAFHRLATWFLLVQQVPLVFDTDATEEVWNFPAYAIDLEVTDLGGEATDLVELNTAEATELDTLPGIGETLADRIVTHRLTYGPFQSVEDLEAVDGIGPKTIEDLRSLVTLTPIERTLNVSATVHFSTDAVPEEHVDDGHPGEAGFTEVWSYTLVTDRDGLVLGGAWTDPAEHPDFAWIPYDNPTWVSTDSSENPYLSYADLVELIGAAHQR